MTVKDLLFAEVCRAITAGSVLANWLMGIDARFMTALLFGLFLGSLFGVFCRIMQCLCQAKIDRCNAIIARLDARR